MTLKIILKGGPGSGHHGHGGRPGKRGGSTAGTGGMSADNIVSESSARNYLEQTLPNAVVGSPKRVGNDVWTGISTSASISDTRKALVEAGFRPMSPGANNNEFRKKGVMIRTMDTSRRSDLPGNTQLSMVGRVSKASASPKSVREVIGTKRVSLSNKRGSLREDGEVTFDYKVNVGSKRFAREIADSPDPNDFFFEVETMNDALIKAAGGDFALWSVESATASGTNVVGSVYASEQE